MGVLNSISLETLTDQLGATINSLDTTDQPLKPSLAAPLETHSGQLQISKISKC